MPVRERTDLAAAKEDWKRRLSHLPVCPRGARDVVGVLELAEDFGLAHHHRFQARGDGEEMLHAGLTTQLKGRRREVLAQLVEAAQERGPGLGRLARAGGGAEVLDAGCRWTPARASRRPSCRFISASASGNWLARNATFSRNSTAVFSNVSPPQITWSSVEIIVQPSCGENVRLAQRVDAPEREQDEDVAGDGKQRGLLVAQAAEAENERRVEAPDRAPTRRSSPNRPPAGAG